MCSSETIIAFLIIVNRILGVIRIIAPILLILSIMISLCKIVINPEDKKIQKRIKNKIFAIVILFFIPTIVRAIIYTVTNTSACLEEEDIVRINSNYNPFANVEYVELQGSSKKKKILPNPKDYEFGESLEGISAPKTNAISNGNAIYFLNVGESSDAIIIQDDNHFGMIDTGVSGGVIVEQLKRFGVKQLDFIMITHSHGDHTGGYNTIMDNFSVKTLIVKADGAKDPAHTMYKYLIETANKKGTSICDVKDPACQSFSLGNINFQLYNVDYLSSSINSQGRFDNVNSICAVVTINGRKIYFTGDIGNYYGHDYESITARQVGDIDIYKVAHHGYTSFNNNLDALKIIKPEYSVVTNSRPRTEAFNRLKTLYPNMPIYFTTNGTITLTINQSGEIKFYQ